MKVVELGSKKEYGELRNVDLDNPMSFDEQQRARNRLLQLLRAFGTVGPMGEYPVGASMDDEPHKQWTVEHSDPDFFIDDDFWTDIERLLAVEIKDCHKFTRNLLEAAVQFLQEYPNWNLSFVAGDESALYVTPQCAYLLGHLKDDSD